MNCHAAGNGPYLLAIGTGLLCALMFSLYPLLRLMKVPPLRGVATGAGPQAVVTVVTLVF